MLVKPIVGTCVMAGYLFMSSCNADIEPKDVNDFDDDLEILSIPVTDILSFNEDESKANEALNDFGFTFANKIVQLGEVKSNENYCVSPLSMSMCMSLVSTAADDKSGALMAQSLGRCDVTTLTSTNNMLMRYLPSNKSGCTLQLANSIWYNKKYTINDSYKTYVAKNYYTETTGLDMNDPSAIARVNRWCKLKTNGLIPEILSDGFLDETTNAIFINALHFKCDWEFPFDEWMTRELPFHGSDGTTSAALMFADELIPFAENARLEAVSLPFKGEMSMAVILPKEDETASALMSSLTRDEWSDLEFNTERVVMRMPKFKTETSLKMGSSFLNSMDLPKGCTLANLGINKISSISVIQKTCIAIDEYGAEGAAATATTVESSTGEPGKPEYRVFAADRPFIYIIYSRTTGSVLMMGCINNM